MAEGALGGSVDVPKVGKIKKAYVYGAVGLVGVYVAYRWYSAGLGTGDVSYETGDIGEGISPSGVVGSGGVSGNTQYSGTVTDDDNSGKIGDNATWTNRAVELLANAGKDPVAVYAALGEFLARRPLDDAEASIARTAIAAVGEPPVNRPWTIIPQVGTVDLKAPTGLKASNVTGTSATLTFSSVSGAAAYSAYRGDLGATVVGTGYGPSITVAGLTPNKTYTFTVAARTAVGKAGPKSAPVTVKTTGAKLTAPAGVKVKSERTSAYVSWAGVQGAGGYLLQLAGRPGSWESTDTSDRVTGLKPNTSYRVRVAAIQPGTRTAGPWSGWAQGKTSK